MATARKLNESDLLRFSQLRKNLIILMQEHGLSATQLANDCLDSQGAHCFTTSTITRFLNNKSSYLRSGTIKSLADFFKVPVDAMTSADLLKFSGLAPLNPLPINTIPLLTGPGALTISPVFSTWVDYPEVDPKCETIGYVPPPPVNPSFLQAHPDLFAFQIQDPAMEPVFNSGDILYLIPETYKSVRNKQFVLIRSKKTDYALARVEESAIKLPEDQQENYVRANSHEFKIRRLLLGAYSDYYAEFIRPDWPGKRVQRLNIGNCESDEQILGGVIGKYTQFAYS